MKKFASGVHALAECQRCGGRGPYLEMVNDGYIKGLRVHPRCYEPEHPQDRPITDLSDPIALERPSPEVSVPANEGTAAPTMAFSALGILSFEE